MPAMRSSPAALSSFLLTASLHSHALSHSIGAVVIASATSDDNELVAFRTPLVETAPTTTENKLISCRRNRTLVHGFAATDELHRASSACTRRRIGHQSGDRLTDRPTDRPSQRTILSTRRTTDRDVASWSLRKVTFNMS